MTFFLATTHDIDIWALRERTSLSKGHLSLDTLRRGNLNGCGEILKSIIALGGDPYIQSFNDLIALEEMNDIRSTFFVIPHNLPGLYAPKYRSSNYSPYLPILKIIEKAGWEIGAHTINAWISWEKGIEERSALSTWYGIRGNRSHWLWHDENSLKMFAKAGFIYDSTYGYDHQLCDTVRPFNRDGIVELPINIQDLAIFGRYCWMRKGENYIRIPCMNLSQSEAKAACRPIIEKAADIGGICTILTHSNNFSPIFDLTDFYKWIIDETIKRDGWIGSAYECLKRYGAL